MFTFHRKPLLSHLFVGVTSLVLTLSFYNGNNPTASGLDGLFVHSLKQAALAVLYGTATFTASNTTSIRKENYICQDPPYTTQIFSFFPLLVYMENFVTEAERKYLMDLAAPLYSSSVIVLDNSGTEGPSPGRTSQSAFLPSNDPVVSCIKSRAAKFQGTTPNATWIETLQAVRYDEGQRYGIHYDWMREQRSGEKGNKEGEGSFRDRFSSFFVVLEGKCERCWTHFPHLKARKEDVEGEAPMWRGKVDWPSEASEADLEGVAFRAIEGNALFWVNLHEDGRGDTRVLHEGIPVEAGSKIGLNIWTREHVPDLDVSGS